MKPMIERHERDVWELGRIVSAARLRCEDPACGIAGPNPDARFGKWVSANFADTYSRRLYEARRLWEVFGQRQEEVERISPRAGTPTARSRGDSLLTGEGRDRGTARGWGPRVG